MLFNNKIMVIRIRFELKIGKLSFITGMLIRFYRIYVISGHIRWHWVKNGDSLTYNL